MSAESGEGKVRTIKRDLMATVAVFVTLAGSAPSHAQANRNVLPIPPTAFSGKITEEISSSVPSPMHPVQAPERAPNILLFMADDVGFAMSSTFGGPVPTPNMDRLAASGQRYNRFHTTALCSTTRAALLTGRNHHNTGVGYLSDTPMGFPGYTGAISNETATIAQVLRLNGYNTAMFGKHHNVPGGQETAAGPFDNWPTGLGFEYFYGIVAGNSDQYNPQLFRGTNRVDPDEGAGRMLERRLADDIITWVHNQKSAAPDKPFFIYYAPGSTHAPHQAPKEYIERFKGKFDQGWDKVREETFRRQVAAGIVPRGTILTARPPEIPAWQSLNDNEKAFAARAMEVAAAQMAYQDEQLGRVLDELERMGVLENTLISVIQGDNGAIGAGVAGTLNDLQHKSGLHESGEWLAANLDKAGGPLTYQNYPIGWAWAMNTPLRWTKQYASRLGGIRNGMILAWPGRVARPGSVCAEFGHVVDVAPTLLEAAGVPAPESVYGVQQKAMDGQSLLPSLSACTPDRPRTQYFELGGKIGLYHQGWFAARDNGRVPWEKAPPAGTGGERGWELYDLTKDFSQATDVSHKHPEKTKELAQIWEREAERNNVFPLEHRFGAARAMMLGKQRNAFEFWGADTSIPAMSVPSFAGKSVTVKAEVKLSKPDASGVVLAVGSHFAGFSLYLDQGKPTFVYARSTHPDHIFRIAASQPVGAASSTLEVRFEPQGRGTGGWVTIASDGRELASGAIAETFVRPSGLTETLDVGRDLGVTVTDYPTHRGRLEGEVPYLRIDFAKPGGERGGGELSGLSRGSSGPHDARASHAASAH